MNGLTQSWTPDGEVKTHSLEASFQRRFSSGFTLNAGYVSLYERDRDFYFNEFDALPSWRQTNAGVPHRFSATGILELPFGRTKPFAAIRHWNAIFGGWQVAATYEWQPGPLLDWGNVFYYGDPSEINTGERTLDRWFNTDNFERDAQRTPAAFQARVFPQRVDGLRGDGLNRHGRQHSAGYSTDGRSIASVAYGCAERCQPLAIRESQSRPDVDQFRPGDEQHIEHDAIPAFPGQNSFLADNAWEIFRVIL